MNNSMEKEFSREINKAESVIGAVPSPLIKVIEKNVCESWIPEN